MAIGSHPQGSDSQNPAYRLAHRHNALTRENVAERRRSLASTPQQPHSNPAAAPRAYAPRAIGWQTYDPAVTTFCTADLNYVSIGEPMPVARTVEIFDARQATLPGWEACGFELVDHVSAVQNWADDEIAAVHHAETESLARSMTGCDHALVSGHIKRGPDEARQHEDLAPITFVHSDFAPSYLDLVRDSYRQADNEGGRAALDRNGITPDDVSAASRVVILQFWRNLGEPRMDHPIAFCDARTVRPDDARPFPVSDYAGSGFNFEALGVLAPASLTRHRWYAFPDLRREEAVAFRTFDTDLVKRGETFFTPHSAFRDPSVPLGQPARRSIELRATCIWR
jgi:hypothetical protein